MSKPWTLVTGASGFVGSRLVRALVDRGERVRAFVRPGSSLRHLEGYAPDQVSLAFGDIMIEHTVYRALAGCERMYHVASNYKMWDTKPERILRPAIEGTRASLRAAQRRGLAKVVVTSSVAALGSEAEPTEMDEEHAFNIEDAETYIRSKKEAYDITREMASELPLVAVMPTGIVGPGDWKPTPTGAGIIKYLTFPGIMRFPVTAGGLNLVDVDDVVSGHILAMEKGTPGESYILGGENVTLTQMFTYLSDVTGLPRPGKPQRLGLVKLMGRAMEVGARFSAGDPPLTYRMARDYACSYIWVTSKKAETELGYTHRSARESLFRSVRWYLEHGYLNASAARQIRLTVQGV